MKVPQVITKFAGKAALKVSKYSPELLIAGGVVAFGATVVLACKQTFKAKEILEEHEEARHQIEEAKGISEEYERHDMKRDLTQLYVRTGAKMVKLYSPAIIAGTLSLGLFLGSYGVMKKRNVALIAAYNGVQAAFDRYRRNVVNELGEEADQRFKFGKEKIQVKVIDDKGKEKTESVDKIRMDDLSEYARVFSKATSPNYEDPIHNLAFLKAQETFFNQLLHARGHVFLSEVYDALGFDRTPASIVVGWVDGYGDNYIDFGIVNAFYQDSDIYNSVHRPVNSEDGYLLDFNVDGVIYDKI